MWHSCCPSSSCVNVSCSGLPPPLAASFFNLLDRWAIYFHPQKLPRWYLRNLALGHRSRCLTRRKKLCVRSSGVMVRLLTGAVAAAAGALVFVSRGRNSATATAASSCLGSSGYGGVGSDAASGRSLGETRIHSLTHSLVIPFPFADMNRSTWQLCKSLWYSLWPSTAVVVPAINSVCVERGRTWI